MARQLTARQYKARPGRHRLVPVSALLLALAAAVVHAAWNLLLSDAEDIHSSTAVAVAAGVVVFAPVAALGWRLHTTAIPYVAASSALETIYLALLASAYSLAAMSFVYPIARGSAPVLVLLVSVIVLGTSASPGAAVGILVVAIGIVLVRGVRSAVRLRDLILALSVGACIAAYTLVDQHGIRHGNPIAYLELVFTGMAVAYVVGVWRLSGPGALRAAIGPRSILAGIGCFGGYALTLAALRLAPAASVAAVRESSVVMATAFLALTGRERVSATRLLGAVAVAGGIALVSLG
jgi:drug/metabolite transporter (DMT)-like permease